MRCVFGYVIANCKALSPEQQQRFRALYCGMCHTLHERYGNLGRFTLSYDMTFLATVLSALYEPEETVGRERCLPHPAKPHEYALNPAMEYAVDLNVALAYHKCADNWQDDRNPAFAAAKGLLARAYRRACEYQPEKCAAIANWMDGIREIEKRGDGMIDPPLNLTGRMLGELFTWKQDHWSEELRRMGDGLGRFIYFMDAYDDLEKDLRHNKFNPLKSIRQQQNFEELCKDALTMMMADCADAFECLPIVRDADLIRNVLYSGVWAKYNYIQSRKEESAKSSKAVSKGAQ